MGNPVGRAGLIGTLAAAAIRQAGGPQGALPYYRDATPAQFPLSSQPERTQEAATLCVNIRDLPQLMSPKSSFAPPPPTVAVVGGGIAGLTQALVLAERRQIVTVFEKRPEPTRAQGVALMPAAAAFVFHRLDDEGKQQMLDLLSRAPRQQQLLTTTDPRAHFQGRERISFPLMDLEKILRDACERISFGRGAIQLHVGFEFNEETGKIDAMQENPPLEVDLGGIPLLLATNGANSRVAAHHGVQQQPVDPRHARMAVLDLQVSNSELQSLYRYVPNGDVRILPGGSRFQWFTENPEAGKLRLIVYASETDWPRVFSSPSARAPSAEKVRDFVLDQVRGLLPAGAGTQLFTSIQRKAFRGQDTGTTRAYGTDVQLRAASEPAFSSDVTGGEVRLVGDARATHAPGSQSGANAAIEAARVVYYQGIQGLQSRHLADTIASSHADGGVWFDELGIRP